MENQPERTKRTYVKKSREDQLTTKKAQLANLLKTIGSYEAKIKRIEAKIGPKRNKAQKLQNAISKAETPHA